MRWFALLLVAWSAQGQLPVVPLPQFQMISSGPDLTQVAYRWVASDLATNSKITGNWTDEIQGAAWLMGASAQQPTNTVTNGVWFDQTHWLTNNGLTIGSNVSFGFIVDVVDPGNFSGQDNPTMLQNGQTTDNTLNLSIAFQDSTSPFWSLASQLNSAMKVFTSAPFRNTNKWSTIIISQSLTNTTGSGNLACYTNDVIAAGFTSGAFGSGAQYWGSRDASYGSVATFPKFLMLNNSRASSAKAFLRELWIWTNNIGNVGTLLSQTRIDNFNNYATNKYGYSP